MLPGSLLAITFSIWVDVLGVTSGMLAENTDEVVV